MIQATDLKIGDKVLYDDGNESTVATVTYINKSKEFVDFKDEELEWSDDFNDIPELVKKKVQ